MNAPNQDFRYAELPDGKILKFPKGTSDEEIRKRVRRELGLTTEDLMATMDGFLSKVTELVDVTREQHKDHRDAIDQVADALQATGNRMTGELADTMRGLKDEFTKQKTELQKISSTQANLIIKLDLAINALNKTLDAALGQSLGAMDEGHANTTRNANSMERSINSLAGLVHRMAQTVEEMSNLKKIRRRAVRERDGSWTMVTD